MTWRLQSIKNNCPLSQGGLCSVTSPSTPPSSCPTAPLLGPSPVLCSPADTQWQILWPDIRSSCHLNDRGNRMETRLPEINVTESRLPYKNNAVLNLWEFSSWTEIRILSFFFFKPNNKGKKKGRMRMALQMSKLKAEKSWLDTFLRRAYWIWKAAFYILTFSRVKEKAISSF